MAPRPYGGMSGPSPGPKKPKGPQKPKTHGGMSGPVKKPKVSKMPDWYLTNRKTGKVSGKTPGWARPKKYDGNTAYLHVNGGKNPSTGSGRGSGGSGGGSGGGGGAPARPPKKKTPPKKKKTPPQTTPPGGAAGAGASTEDPDKKMWEELFGPARREIERQKSLLEQKKTADTSAWDSYNKWAEDQRAKTAGLLTTAQKDQQTAFSASKAASDASIQQFISAARGGTENAPQGSELSRASGLDTMASTAAASSSAANQQSYYQQASAALQNKQIEDQASLNKAIAERGQSDLTAQYTKASNSLASKGADVETAYQQAKLDKFYKDRQYGLDRETLDWTKSLQGAQLELSREAQILKAQIDGQALAGTDRQRAIDNALATRRITNDEARILQGTVNAGNTQANANVGRGAKLLDWAEKTYPEFETMDTHKQGQAIIKSIARARAQGLSASLAWQTLEAAFGSRFTHPTVFKHFKARYPKYKRR